MQTREFSFGAALYEHKLPDDKLSRLERCLTELRSAEFTEPASNGEASKLGPYRTNAQSNTTTDLNES